MLVHEASARNFKTSVNINENRTFSYKTMAARCTIWVSGSTFPTSFWSRDNVNIEVGNKRNTDVLKSDKIVWLYKDQHRSVAPVVGRWLGWMARRWIRTFSVLGIWVTPGNKQPAKYVPHYTAFVSEQSEENYALWKCFASYLKQK